ncbi:MAG: hypothetical protein ACXWCY_33550 [Burkholderiales bacterium]
MATGFTIAALIVLILFYAYVLYVANRRDPMSLLFSGGMFISPYVMMVYGVKRLRARFAINVAWFFVVLNAWAAASGLFSSSPGGIEAIFLIPLTLLSWAGGIGLAASAVFSAPIAPNSNSSGRAKSARRSI